MKGKAKQNSGFQPDHIQISLLGYLSFAFKIHIKLLTFANFCGSFIEQADDFRKHCRIGWEQQIISFHHHNVTRKYSDVVIPLFMDSCFSSSQRSLVHDVVMHQGEIVKNLNSGSLTEDIFGIIFIHSIRHHGEQGADSLSSQAQDIGDGLV